VEKTAALLFALFTTALAVSCGDTSTGPTEAPLQGAWRLQVLQATGDTRQTISEPERFTAEFLADGALHVRADCNRCNGTYTLSGRSLTVSALACTRAACQLAELESAFTRLLQGATGAESLPDTLQLSGPSGALVLRR